MVISLFLSVALLQNPTTDFMCTWSPHVFLPKKALRPPTEVELLQKLLEEMDQHEEELQKLKKQQKLLEELNKKKRDEATRLLDETERLRAEREKLRKRNE